MEQATNRIKQDSPYRERGVATPHRPLSKDRGFSLYGDFTWGDSMSDLNCSIGGVVCGEKDVTIESRNTMVGSMTGVSKTSKPRFLIWLLFLVMIAVMMIVVLLLAGTSEATECLLCNL